MTGALQAERRRALRTLLRRPLLPASGETEEEYSLVRRHSVWLKDWLTKFPAWSFHADKEVARLCKVPPDLLDETRPAVDRISGTAFSRRRYALLCLVLAALEQSDGQATISRIAQTIIEFATADPALAAAGVVFDMGNYDQRRDLVHTVRLLMDTGVLRRIEGDETQFLNRSGTSCQDALYEINQPILRAILNVSRSASAIEATESGKGDSLEERASRLIDDPIPESEDAGAQRMRARLVRALLDDPVLYFDDLNDAERIYLQQHGGYLLRQVHEATGLLAEVRREGIALVDDAGDLTDIQMPVEDVDGDLSPLLVPWLAERARDSTSTAIPASAIEQYVLQAGGEVRLIEDTLSRLRELRLIRSTADGIVPLALCGRYRAAENFRDAI